MRITCPNCQAKYEVGQDMIPAEGRDVQCSNCGTTWFQEGRGREALPPGERRRPSRPLPREEADANANARAARPQRPTPDAETLDILREERERAERLRSGAKQTSTGVPDAEIMDEGDPRAVAAAERSRLNSAAERARGRRQSTVLPQSNDEQSDDDIADVIAETLRAANPASDGASDTSSDGSAGEALAAAAAPLSARAARKELLPDIEEINSSLRPDERAAEAAAEAGEVDDAEEVEPRQKRMSGFRIGFVVAFLVIVILIAVYVFADQIAAAAPQLGDILTNYVAWVDAQRVSLASGVEALTDSISPDP
ncbi:MJ0042 family finger-like domain-containing protein [Jannaschia pohangensis]|uniref:MJ0042 family finger-like domain-containing protein n=2 Tax=Jannaschia pohangensis TaxID=390807 RepID=A0A1I3MU38_9RHOB|nr:zinc-ribbon domain-containing protein [Jannaschia pohangensis]SFJ00451.1 MJ0042 family finger-like domain-containing protein [Jannaschia pohangensis]